MIRVAKSLNSAKHVVIPKAVGSGLGRGFDRFKGNVESDAERNRQIESLRQRKLIRRAATA